MTPHCEAIGMNFRKMKFWYPEYDIVTRVQCDFGGPTVRCSWCHVMQGYPGHDVIFRVPNFYFSKVHSNAFTMRCHMPLSAAESPRGVLGRARPFAKRPPGSNSYGKVVLIMTIFASGRHKDRVLLFLRDRFCKSARFSGQCVC